MDIDKMIDVKIDTTKVVRSLNNMINSFSKSDKWREPLQKSEKLVMDESKRNFDTQGLTYGSAWRPLKESTRKQRESMGFPSARPILIRTGGLKRAYKGEIKKDEGIIRNESDIAKYHQFGTRKIS